MYKHRTCLTATWFYLLPVLCIIKSVQVYLHGGMWELNIVSTFPVPDNSKQSLAWDSCAAVFLQYLELIPKW